MRDFSTKKFSAIDSLILSQFSYMFFDGIVPGVNKIKKSVRLKDVFLAEHMEKILNEVLAPEEDKRLFVALVGSPRFRNINMNYYVNEIDIKQEKQFSAVSFILDKNTSYIAFKGTDATLIGWKEDFNMAFLDEVPSQTSAVEYVNKIARRLPRDLIIGGHSKGGNLAVFASAMCKPVIQKRICAIYSHDGPGFKKMLESKQYKIIKERVHKTVPQSAIIGMLLIDQEDYTVVKSSKSGILQHDAFSWEIEEDEFSQLEKVSGSSKFMNRTLHELLLESSDEDRERFVEALYKIINVTEATTIFDLQKLKIKDIKKIIELTSDMDTKTKKFLFNAVKDLIILSVKNIRE